MMSKSPSKGQQQNETSDWNSVVAENNANIESSSQLPIPVPMAHTQSLHDHVYIGGCIQFAPSLASPQKNAGAQPDEKESLEVQDPSPLPLQRTLSNPEPYRPLRHRANSAFGHFRSTLIGTRGKRNSDYRDFQHHHSDPGFSAFHPVNSKSLETSSTVSFEGTLSPVGSSILDSNTVGGNETLSSQDSGHNQMGSGGKKISPPRLGSKLLSGIKGALKGPFPCESDGNNVSAAHNGDVSTSPAVTVTSTSAPNYLNTNSFMAQNNIIDAEKPSPPTTHNQGNINISSSSLNIRGGGDSIDDDELDQMVDNLIAGLDIMNESEESEEETIDEYDQETQTETESEDIDHDENENETLNHHTQVEIEEEDIIMSEENNEQESEKTNTDEPPLETISQDSSPPMTQSNSSTTRPLNHNHSHSRPTQTKSPIANPTITPTNAYYRFLVRRGPKGHLLASFTLLSVQYIYTYIPHLYQSIAAILLKLHIYNPKVLYERDYQRQMELKYGPRKKRGLTSKLFGTSSSSLNKKKMKNEEAKAALQHEHKMQKRADQDAATKLKQLYKTMKDGSGVGMLSEVKYRYLSGEFRRRHGLGKEYRVEKPRTFMGEVVEGGSGIGMVGNDALLDSVDIVFSDGELEVDQEAGGSFGQDAHEVKRNKQRKGQQQTTTRRVKRKPKINDWVVKAFASSVLPRKESSTSASADTAIASSLWKSVERDAIVAAAWESRAAEQSATATPNGRRRGSATKAIDNDGKKVNGRDGDIMIEASGSASNTDGSSGSISSGGYGASKMFQSVMTRVGSGNGRIFGAYPNDAPSIEDCAHERGVIGFARRYGYGDWTADDDFEYDGNLMHSDDEDGAVLWGGGDLMFDGVDNDGPEVGLHPSSSRKRSNGGHKSRRKKKRTSSTLNIGNDVPMTAVKKRRKRSSKK